MVFPRTKGSSVGTFRRYLFDYPIQVCAAEVREKVPAGRGHILLDKPLNVIMFISWKGITNGYYGYLYWHNHFIL